MKELETNDWVTLNQIIYNIYSIENLTDMRNNFLEQMKSVIDFDSAEFYLAGGEGGEGLAFPVTYNSDREHGNSYGEREYARNIIEEGKSRVYRESDMAHEDVRLSGGRPYSLHLALGSGGEFLGIIMFYRTVDKGDFHYNDIFLLDMLKDHLALRLAKERDEREKAGGKITISTAVREYALTRREDTILRLLLAGLNNQEICEQLVISVNTLKKHVLNIYRKLGIRNRVQMFKMIREKE